MLYGEKPIEVYKESFVIGSAIEASLSFILVYFLLRIYYCCWPIVVYVLLPISLPIMPHKLLFLLFGIQSPVDVMNRRNTDLVQHRFGHCTSSCTCN